MKSMHNIILILLCFSLQGTLQGQDSNLAIEVNRDTVLLGNTVKVKFTLENYEGEFTSPSFDEFDILGGPNVATSVSIINGDMSKTESYSYILQPRETGEYIIGEEVISNQGMQKEEIKIIVVDNPDGIIQDNAGYKGMGNFTLPKPSSDARKKKYNRRKI